MNEIEEFLKRAAAMRARQQGTQPVAQPPAPSRAAPIARRPVSSLVQDAEVVEAEEITSGADVSEHVSRHLNSGSFNERASHLGKRIKSTDEVIESHLHETFEHKLGSLGATTAQAEDSILDDDENAAARANAPPTLPQALAALLRSPQSLRNAIILSEVLNPPRARW